MTITKPWDLLKDERIDAFNSGVRLIADANKQGTGKTFSWSKILMENNLNNIILSNNHAIMDDLYKYVDNIIDPSIKKMIFYPLFGRDYLLTSEEMGLYGMPKCLCNLYGDRLFNLRKFGLLYNNYCKLCKYRHECYHKKNNRELFNSIKNKFSSVPKLIMAPKAYTDTSLMDKILDKFDGINLILDEEILNMMYQQYDLTPASINNYNKFVKKMIFVDGSLKAEYKDFAPVFMAIDNALRYIGADEKNIVKSFIELKESHGINDCIEWNEKFKKSVLKSDYYGIGWAEEYHAFNIFNYIIKILEDGIKNGDFSRGISIDKKKEIFSYFINKIDRVREVVYKTYRTILTDSNQNRIFGPKFFPEFADSFKFLQISSLKI